MIYVKNSAGIEAKETVQDIFEWDVLNWSQALDIWNPVLSTGKELNCLELGGRRGGLSLLAALQGHIATCSDLENPKDIAQPLHKKYRVQNQIDYKAIDATNIVDNEVYDVILFKSILGGIGRKDHFELQQKVIESSWKALKPGGTILFAENLRGTFFHHFLRTKFTRWGNEWRYVKSNEIDVLFEKFSDLEYKTKGVLGLLGRSEKQRNFLSYFDRYLLDHILPSSAKYFCYGRATKKVS